MKEETPAAVVDDNDEPVTYDKAFKPSAVLRKDSFSGFLPRAFVNPSHFVFFIALFISIQNREEYLSMFKN